MIPRADIEIRQDTDFTDLRAPNPDDVDYPGWAGIIHHHTVDIWNEASWEEAGSLLQCERRLLDRLDREASTPTEYEALLETASSDEADLLMSWCDFGVGAAVWGLNAAGYVTASSCSGHESGGPHVLLACDHERARALVPIATASSCGLAVVGTGLELWAASVAEMVACAALLINRRDDFDLMPLIKPRLVQ